MGRSGPQNTIELQDQYSQQLKKQLAAYAAYDRMNPSKHHFTTLNTSTRSSERVSTRNEK
jgi:hypothetical protein